MKIAEVKKQKLNNLIWLQIKNGDDLLDRLSSYCLKNNIKAGLIFAIGAMKKARISFYDQAKKKYLIKRLDQPLEIISGLGNISLKDGRPFVHLHLALADKAGRAYGGHLETGSIVFACECAIAATEGEPLERKLDGLTGLNLWDFNKQ